MHQLQKLLTTNLIIDSNPTRKEAMKPREKEKVRSKMKELCYVYLKSEQGVWTVGFYLPDGEWYPESDYNSSEEAAKRVHYLNGGN